MHERPALYTELIIPSTRTVRWLKTFCEFLDEIPEVSYRYWTKKSTLEIVISFDSDHLSKRSPVSTHEFCRGWIVRGIVEAIDDRLNHAVKWEHIEWLHERWQIVRTHEEGAPRELKRVDPRVM